MTKMWIGPVPTDCDLCLKKIEHTFIDGVTTTGLWAYMCIACHAQQGGKLGVGQGQKYEFQDDRWVQDDETR